MFLINLNAEIAACILSLRHKPNLENTSKYGFSPDLGEKNGGVLSMRMQVILDSSFARPGSAPIWGGKKEEFRDWTTDWRTPLTEYIVYVIESAAYGVIFTSCFLSKTRTSEVRASEGFWHKQRVNKTQYKALSMSWAVYYTKQENFHWTSFLNAN